MLVQINHQQLQQLNVLKKKFNIQKKTKSENYNKISITDESNNNFEGIIGRYGDTGEEIYFTNSISYPYYFKVIE